MILSVSRRTDVPRFYFDWFLNRLREGFVLVRNPMNFRQVSRVALSPETVECIVFWTKDPAPMIPQLDGLGDYPFYVQFTINAYGNDIEMHLPEKARLIDTFKRLADRIGPERTVWRFSPVLFTEHYTTETQQEAFSAIVGQLAGYTESCKLSFLDPYPKIRKEMARLGAAEGTAEQRFALTKQFLAVAREHGIDLTGCAQELGIPHASCIDGDLIARITGERNPKLRKDPGQRPECGCVASVDIGSYDTCLNGCRYCYANVSYEAARRRFAAYDPAAPMLCDQLRAGDKVTGRKLQGSSRR